VPGGFGVQILLPLVFAVVPAGHNVHCADPAEEKDPGEHLIHALKAIAFILMFAVPAGQSVHLVCASKLLYVPSRQGMHSLLPSSYVPIGQALQIDAPASE